MLVFSNQQANSGDGADVSASLETKLRDAGFELSVHRVDGVDDANRLIERFSSDVDAIVIGGGDGSIRSMLPAILKTGLPMGVWPLGTANDFARSLGIEDEDDCVAALTAWNPRWVDVAEVNGRHFINNAALGLPTEAAMRLTSDLKARLGVFATLALIPKLLRKGKPFHVEIDADGRVEQRSVVAVLIGNGMYKGGFPIQYSGLSDGKLHVTLCRARSRWSLIPMMVDVLLKRIERSSRIETFSALRVSVRTTGSKRISADGDIVSETPAMVTLHAKAVQVFERLRAA